MHVTRTHINSYPSDKLIYVEFEGDDGEMIIVRLKPEHAGDRDATIERAREVISRVAAEEEAPLTPEERRAMWASYLDQMRACETRLSRQMSAANRAGSERTERRRRQHG